MQNYLNKKIILAFFFFFSFFTVISNTKAVTDGSFNLISPSTGNLTESCSYSLDIRVNTGSNNSNSADIIILYTPSEVEILDSIDSRSGKQIKPGTAYEAYFGNQVDETAGIIRLTGASFSENFVGEGLFGSIEFRGKPGVTQSDFTIKFEGASETNTLDSNIAVSETSLDALGSVSNATLNFVPGNCIIDTEAPNINYINPVNNQSNVPLEQNIEINLTDNLSGVNLDTLQVLVNGVPYTASDPEVTITGSSNNYNLVINPRDNFYPNSPSSIVVSVSDNVGNNRQSNISFNFPSAQPTPTTIPTTIPTSIPTSSPINTPTPTPNPALPTSQNTPTQPQAEPSQPTDAPAQTATPVPTTLPENTPTPVVNIDRIPPQIGFITPVSRQTIDNQTQVVIKITDTGSGINLDTLQILINEKRYTRNDFVVDVNGNINEYTIIITDEFNFSAFSSSYITVFISDFAGNSTVNNIIFNVPEDALLSPEEYCKELLGISENDPINGIPLGDDIKNLQNSLPDQVKPIVEKTGLLGLASLLAAIPFIIWIGSILGSFVAGGFFIPWLLGLFASNRENSGTIIDSVSKSPISFAKIEIYDKKNGLMIKNVVSNHNGKFYLDLAKGSFKAVFIKKEYEILEKDIFVDEDDFRFVETVEIDKLNINDFASDLQFKTIKIDPKVLSIYFALFLAFLNILYTRSIVSMIILGILIIAAIIVPKRFKKAPVTEG